MPKYAELIYNGFWFSPEREMLQALIDRSQEFVTGQVRLKLYKGNVIVIGRTSPYSLYDQDLVTFEEGAVAYDHRDAAGFIKLNALRLRTLGRGSASWGFDRTGGCAEEQAAASVSGPPLLSRTPHAPFDPARRARRRHPGPVRLRPDPDRQRHAAREPHPDQRRARRLQGDRA